MGNDRETSAGKPGLQVRLDGMRVELTSAAQESLASIRTQLELLALRQERVLSALRVDGIEVSLVHTPCLGADFQSIEADTISLADYSRHLLRRVQDQVHLVRRRLEAMVLLVLINEWPVIEWLCQGLQSDLQVPLIKLGFLHEFYADRLNENPEAHSLGSHWPEFRTIWQRLEQVMVSQDKIALSDALEHDLLAWLIRTERCLIHFDRNHAES